MVERDRHVEYTVTLTLKESCEIGYEEGESLESKIPSIKAYLADSWEIYADYFDGPMKPDTVEVSDIREIRMPPMYGSREHHQEHARRNFSLVPHLRERHDIGDVRRYARFDVDPAGVLRAFEKPAYDDPDRDWADALHELVHRLDHPATREQLLEQWPATEHNDLPEGCIEQCERSGSHDLCDLLERIQDSGEFPPRV